MGRKLNYQKGHRRQFESSEGNIKRHLVGFKRWSREDHKDKIENFNISDGY